MIGWRIEKVGFGDPRLPEGSKGVALPTGEILYTTPEVLGHELAHVSMRHSQTYRKGMPRGDIMFWQEVDANVLALLRSRFDPDYLAQLELFFDELQAEKDERLFYSKKSVSRLAKKGFITSNEAVKARERLERHYLGGGFGV